MAGDYTYDKSYATDPVFNFSPPKSGSGVCPSLADQLETAKIENMMLKNKILRLKLKKLQNEVSAPKSHNFDLEAKIKAVREIMDGEAREVNQLLKEYAEKPKAPLRVDYPFGGSRVVDS